MAFVSCNLFYYLDFLSKLVFRAYSNICTNTSFQMNQIPEGEGSDLSVIKFPPTRSLQIQGVILFPYTTTMVGSLVLSFSSYFYSINKYSNLNIGNVTGYILKPKKPIEFVPSAQSQVPLYNEYGRFIATF
jgi:hypothetical protein